MYKILKTRKKMLTMLFFLSCMTSDWSHATSALTITEEGNVEIGGKNTKNTLKLNGEGIVSVPIGSVIDWWRPNDSTQPIPYGFLVCDGHSINDPDSPYNGKALPNLINKFTRGAPSLGSVGNEGGKDTAKYSGSVKGNGSHAHAFNDHGNRTLPISNGGENPGRRSYKVQNMDYWDQDPWGHIVVDRSYYSERSGNHRHDLPVTDKEGYHDHELNIEIDTIPKYVGLLKIMRIK